MVHQDYTVRIDTFEGPLDLLLYLIQRAEVEVTDIPIAAIAEQYLVYLEQLDTIDIELAGEFLVVAATLMEIKSKLLTSTEDQENADRAAGLRGLLGDNEDDTLQDPRASLVRQLLAYKRYRDAAEALDDRREAWSQRHGTSKTSVNREALRDATAQLGELDVEDLGVYDLAKAFERLVLQVDFHRIGEHKVQFDADDTPIEVYANRVLTTLRSSDEGSMLFQNLFEAHKPGQMLGTFLALLELIRQQAVAVVQDEATGEIALTLRTDNPPPEAPDSAAPAPQDANEDEGNIAETSDEVLNNFVV